MNRLEPALLLDGHASWLSQARLSGGQHWVRNAACDVCCSDAGNPPIPVTRLHTFSAQDSYVASARSAWLRYAQDEAQRKSRSLGTLAQVAALPLSGLITAARLDEAAVINNWLISTNLHPDWQDSDLSLLTESVMARHCDSPLLLRNVSDAVNPGLAQRLAAQGWTLLPARQIYTCDPQDPAVWQSPNVKRDQKLLAQPELQLCGPDTLSADDLPALRRCFRALFIDKHSVLNPDFTDAFFALCLDKRFLELHALRLDGRIVGVIGFYQRYGWLTTPLLGYDTTLPPELGLYRRLMALLLREAQARGLRLHYSSGAGAFKQHRGGVPALEYSAVFSGHLPGRQRLALGTLAGILQRMAGPILSRHG